MTKVRFSRLAAALLLLCCFAPAAFAFPNKDMITMQAQLQQLLDQVARLQQSNDERMGVLKDLVQQNADSVNRMSVTVTALEKQLSAAQTAQGGKVDQVSGQIQSLNDSLDEMKARMNRLEKAMNEVSSQQQNLAQTLQNTPQTGTAAPVLPPPVQQSAIPVPAPTQVATNRVPAPPAAAIPATSAPIERKPGPAAANQPLVDDMYKAAFNDFMAARYTVASAEFGDVIKAYPDNQLTGNAFYYLGEIEYRAAKYSNAVRDYDKVIEQFPDNNKVPAAHLHKGQAYVEMKMPDNGVREFRSLIQRFPNSPEAGQAKAKLSALGASAKPKNQF